MFCFLIKTIKFNRIFFVSILLGGYFYTSLSTLHIIPTSSENSYIKWVDFTPTYEVLSATSKLDIDSHNSDSDIKYNWIELLAYLACKYGGDFDRFKNSDLNDLMGSIGTPIIAVEAGIIEFLRKNTSQVYKNEDNDYTRKFQMFEPDLYEL